MSSLPASTSAPADSATPIEPLLRGGWLTFARAAFLTIAMLTLILFIVAVPISYTKLQAICTTACEPWELTADSIKAFHSHGISVAFYAGYMVALESAYVAVFVIVAAFIFSRRPAQPLALLGAFTLVTFTADTGTLSMLAEVHPFWSFLTMGMRYTSSVAFTTFVLLFPSGRFIPRWTRWAAVAWAVLEFPGAFWYESPFNFRNWPAPLELVVWVGMIGTALAAQIYRYRWVASTVQRQQTKWALFCMTAGGLGFLGMVVLATLFPWLDRPGEPVAFAVAFGFYASKALIPIGLGIAILRYRLWDIDPIINRTLLYGALTACIVGLYMFIVVYLGALFRTSGNTAIALVATGVVAVIFQPLRERLQQAINRLMYGERAEPYAVLSRLGQRLEASLAPETVLPTIVQTVKEALKLPYVAIALKHNERFAVAAEQGQAGETLVELPLIYQNETVGTLLLAPGSSGEGRSPTDRRLLDDLARQAGIAVHAVRLTAELQRAREQVVTAREEERRRLRRDLHDGIGPQLASQTLMMDAALKLLPRDPEAVAQLLAELKAQSQAATADIRRIVYDLRPPALDDLGLVNALHEQAAHYAATGVQITVDAPDCLPALPAAVEVAAYRIVQEALTNVVRHARAQTCVVRLRVDDALHIWVSDDGCGVPATRRAGVGLLSMHERASELGGSCVITAGAHGGTEVAARLPLPDKE